MTRILELGQQNVMEIRNLTTISQKKKSKFKNEMSENKNYIYLV